MEETITNPLSAVPPEDADVLLTLGSDADDGNDYETQMLLLVRSLELQHGFGLYFLTVRQAEQRQRVLEDLRLRQPRPVREHFLRTPITHLLADLQATFPDLVATSEMAGGNGQETPLLCVYGMENWLGNVTEVQDSPLIGDLNATRNRFPEVLRCPLLFLLPEHVLVGIMRGAPDFFSVRSGAYFFDTPVAGRSLPSAEGIISAELRAALGAGIEGRQRQAAEWEELLNGYRALPPERKDTSTLLAEARAMENLATIYEANGNYTNALPLFTRALAIRESALGASHPDTATSLNNLAGLYEDMGRVADALPLFERALAICESELGASHPDTATSLNNLAMLYKNMGRVADALPLSERALAICESALGASHPDTATSLNNLAVLYKNMGRFSDALPLFERALAICESALGASHPDTATSLNNLAVLYRGMGRVADALPLSERTVQIFESALGASHPDTATSLNNLAALYKDMGRFADALPLYERALTIRESELGANHPDTVNSRESLATLRAEIEKQNKALKTKATNH